MMNKAISTLIGSSVLAAGIAIAATPAQAFSFTSQLTGDPRPSNPDNLFVDVTVTSGEDGIAANQAKFFVDINSPLHPDIKLDAFFFNIGSYDISDISLISSDPTAWNVFEGGNNAVGSGGADFAFKIDKTGPGGQNNITNSTDLEFIVELNSGTFSENDFFNAISSTSNDNILGSGQMGAHLQSLGPDGEDSGFAMGNYNITDNNNNNNNAKTPEPSTILALGLIGSGMFLSRRRQNA